MKSLPRIHFRMIGAVLLLVGLLSSGEGFARTMNKSSGKKDVSLVCPDDMVYIPGGMVPSKGNEEQKGTTLIYLDEYCIDRYEYPNKKGETPSIKVTWFEAKVYCEKIGKRLCSGEEWEKACAGKNWYEFSYGNRFVASKCGLGRKPTRDVDKSGSYPDCKSDYGVYDMIGGVWEWTNDPPYKIYVKRGGYVNAGPDEANCFARKNQPPKSAGLHDGFRCCMDIPMVSKSK